MTSATTAAAAVSATPVTTVRYGGFGIRLLAYLIDIVILLVFILAIGVILTLTAGREAAEGASTIVIGISQILYYVFFWGRRGATPGKKLLKLRVKIKDTPHYGPGIGDGRAFVRLIGYALSSIPFLLGFLLIPFNAEKRGLHDYIAGTIVVREE